MLRKIKHDIKQAQNRLIKKKICENFGRNELRKLEEKYLNNYDSLIQYELNKFYDWCINYEPNS